MKSFESCLTEEGLSDHVRSSSSNELKCLAQSISNPSCGFRSVFLRVLYSIGSFSEKLCSYPELETEFAKSSFVHSWLLELRDHLLRQHYFELVRVTEDGLRCRIRHSSVKKLCSLARSINKSSSNCREVFLDLLKSVRLFSARVARLPNFTLRLDDFSYVLKQLRDFKGYLIEQEAFANKSVGQEGQFYVPHEIKENHLETAMRAAEWAEKTEVFFKSKGRRFSVPMSDLIPTAQDKENEIYTDMLAMQMIAEEKHLYQVLLTFTAPGKYHSNPQNGNGCYEEGLSSRDSYKFVSKVCRSFYKSVKRAGYEIMGFTTVEPHKDGAAHIHCGWYVPEEALPKIKKVLASLEKRTGARNDLSEMEENKEILEDLGQPTAKASSYGLKYVKKSYSDPDVAAWYSSDCGGAIRRVNICGVKSYKTVFNFLFKHKDQLSAASGVFKEIGMLLNDEDKPLSCKKKEFITKYAGKVKPFYEEKINKFGEKVKGGSVLYVYEAVFDEEGKPQSDAEGHPCMKSSFMPTRAEIMDSFEIALYLNELAEETEMEMACLIEGEDDSDALESTPSTVNTRCTSIEGSNFSALPLDGMLREFEQSLGF